MVLELIICNIKLVVCFWRGTTQHSTAQHNTTQSPFLLGNEGKTRQRFSSYVWDSHSCTHGVSSRYNTFQWRDPSIKSQKLNEASRLVFLRCAQRAKDNDICFEPFHSLFCWDKLQKIKHCFVVNFICRNGKQTGIDRIKDFFYKNNNKTLA